MQTYVIFISQVPITRAGLQICESGGEVVEDGKTYIFDNKNPKGILKSEWLENLWITHPDTKLPITGSEIEPFIKAGE